MVRRESQAQQLALLGVKVCLGDNALIQKGLKALQLGDGVHGLGGRMAAGAAPLSSPFFSPPLPLQKEKACL